MSLIEDASSQALLRSLDLRHRRQELLAANLANADTPNYQPVDYEFEGALQKALNGTDDPPGMAETSEGHLDGHVGQEVRPDKLVVRPDVTNTLDGNGVDTDLELARFSDNGLRYEATVEMTRRRYAMLLDIITRAAG